MYEVSQSKKALMTKVKSPRVIRVIRQAVRLRIGFKIALTRPKMTATPSKRAIARGSLIVRPSVPTRSTPGTIAIATKSEAAVATSRMNKPPIQDSLPKRNMCCTPQANRNPHRDQTDGAMMVGADRLDPAPAYWLLVALLLRRGG